MSGEDRVGEKFAGGYIGSIWELRVSCGEVGRLRGCGGGVVDKALGLLNPDATGEEAAGDGASWAPGIGPKMFRMFSSSDGVLISTSLRRDDRNDGAA